MKWFARMRSVTLALAVAAVSLSLSISDAEAARRLGGGGSMGMQRQSISAPKAAPTPTPSHAAPAAPQSPMAAPQAQPKRSWMGPLAGLAAGIGLAALASHFGFGEELASMAMIGLAVVVGMMVIGWLMRRRAPARPYESGLAMQGAGRADPAMAYQGFERAPEVAAGNAYAPVSPVAGATAPSGNIPADFDVDGFLRHAKVNFIRLQAANDAGNLDDIREFTSPEMFAEIKLALGERGQAAQETDVVSLNAELLDVSEEAQRYVASVRFNGTIREERNAPAEAFDEIWNLTKPKSGGGWTLAGIQQVQ